MKNRLTLLLAALSVCTALSAKTLTVNSGSGPVPMATVTDRQGVLSAPTGFDGRTDIVPSRFPVEISAAGMLPSAANASTDTVTLISAPRRTRTIVPSQVKQGEGITSVKAYVREHISIIGGSDTTLLYNEYTVEYLMPDSGLNLRGANPRPMATERATAGRVLTDGRDSLFIYQNMADKLSLLQLAAMPQRKSGAPGAFIKGETDSCTVMSGKDVSALFVRDGSRVTRIRDILADEHRTHERMFDKSGYDITLTSLWQRVDYTPAPGGLISAAGVDEIRLVAEGDAVRRGRDSDELITVRWSVEVYPYETSRTTPYALSQRKNRPRKLAPDVPEGVPTVDSATEQYVKAARLTARPTRTPGLPPRRQH